MGGEFRADLVLRGGDVYLVNAARSWAQAVAVADGQIAAVGSDAEISAWIGPAVGLGDRAGSSGPDARGRAGGARSPVIDGSASWAAAEVRHGRVPAPACAAPPTPSGCASAAEAVATAVCPARDSSLTRIG